MVTASSRDITSDEVHGRLANAVASTVTVSQEILTQAEPSIKPRGIGILVAMIEEAQPLAESLSLRECGMKGLTDHGFSVFMGTVSSMTVVLVAHGLDVTFGMDRVGPEVAVFATSLLTQAMDCLCVINAGTAGAMEGTHSVGQVVVAKTVTFLDRRIDTMPVGECHSPGPSSMSCWHRTHQLVKYLHAKGCNVVSSTVGTGSAFDPSEADLATIRLRNVKTKEMEAAGVSFVCTQQNIPFVSLSLSELALT